MVYAYMTDAIPLKVFIPDNLIAEAVAVKNVYLPWNSYVKWCCMTDMSTLMHESEYRTRNH